MKYHHTLSLASLVKYHLTLYLNTGCYPTAFTVMKDLAIAEHNKLVDYFHRCFADALKSGKQHWIKSCIADALLFGITLQKPLN